MQPISPQRMASIDLGSNAVRLLIGEMNRRGRLQVLGEQRASIRLGQDSFAKGFISPFAEHKLIETLLLFRYLCKKTHVTRIQAVGTSALRDARNSEKIIKNVFRETGIQIQIIDGREEARLVHQAIGHKISLTKKNALLLDLGGGSLECIISQSNKIRLATSLDLGTVRLLHKTNNSPFYHDYAQLVNSAIYKLINENPIFQTLLTENLLIGTGGNFRCLGRLCSQISRKSAKNKVSINDLVILTDKLFACSLPKRMRKFDLKSDRADVILPAAVIALELMRALNFNTMLVPDVGLKNGLLWKMAHRNFKN